MSFYNTKGKRILDLVLTVPATLLLLPVGVVVGIAIKIDSQGPIIYKQKRIGKGAKEFSIFKFRTMVSNADKIGSLSTQANDNRITRTGKILRKLSLDELPQLLNVLLGNMSIVGYRPGVRLDYTNDELENGFLFTVKPGITGYAQVNGRSALTLEEKRSWEIKYIREISFLTDLKLIIKTIGVVFNRSNTN